MANCPAMRPTFTVGTPVLYVSTTAIWRITLSLSRMASAENTSNDSAQSPAWSRKPSPRGYGREVSVNLTGLAREHERRERPQLGERGVERARVGPVRLLAGRAAPPAVGGPVGAEHRSGADADRVSLRGSRSAVRRWAAGHAGPVPGSSARAAHLVELLLRRRLLGEEGRLDAVEQALEPADELGLGEAQLRLASAHRW